MQAKVIPPVPIMRRVQAMEVAMDSKWGKDQLLCLVDGNLGNRLKQQKDCFTEAYYKGRPDVAEVEGESLIRGYVVCDKKAEELQRPKISMKAVEGVLSTNEKFLVVGDGVPETEYPKNMLVFTIKEIATAIHLLGETALELKRELYGSTLTEIRKVNKKDEEFFDDIIPF